MPVRDSLPSSAETGAWTFDGDDLVRLPPSEMGPAVVLAPTERLLLLSVDLPLPTRRQRVAALPFALEDRLAQPLEQIHVALGVALGERRYLAAAVDQAQMAAWTTALDAAGLGRHPLVPDVLTLPTPEPDTWSILLAGDRALVRTPDRAGFALAASLLSAAWAAAGQPLLVSYGDRLPVEMTALANDAVLGPLALRLTDPALDLRQGVYGSRSQPIVVALKRLAAVLLIGALIHTAIAAGDTLALHSIAGKRRAEALTAIRTVAPTTTESADLVSELDRLLPPAGGGRSAFFPLLIRTSNALKPLSGEAAVRSLAYAAADGVLTLQVEASDIAGLQRIGAALGATGLNASTGAATAGAGRADGEFIVRTDAGRP